MAALRRRRVALSADASGPCDNALQWYWHGCTAFALVESDGGVAAAPVVQHSSAASVALNESRITQSTGLLATRRPKKHSSVVGHGMPSLLLTIAVLIAAAHPATALQPPKLAARRSVGTCATAGPILHPLRSVGRGLKRSACIRCSALPGLPSEQPKSEVAVAAQAATETGEELESQSIGSRARFFSSAIAVGGLTGVCVAVFKISIAAVATALYGDDETFGWTGAASVGGLALLIPSFGGLIVSAVRALSPGGKLGPGLAEHVSEVERGAPVRPLASFMRALASVATLGTGNSLGPEGPSVELGVGVSRLVAGVTAKGSIRRQRQLLAAGAAAGVAAGFNAPLAGVFFALEVVSEAVRSAVETEDNSATSPTIRRAEAELDVKSRTSISGIVLCSLVSAVIVQSLIGSELALRPGAYTVRSPLVELPLYVGLGILSGVTAIIFERVTSGARALFRPPTYKPAPSSTDGSQSIGTAVDKTDAEGIGGGRVLERRGGRLSAVPVQLRPALGGLFCGAIGFAFPQVLFFGYSTLDAILASGGTAINTAAAKAAASASLSQALSGTISPVSAPLFPPSPESLLPPLVPPLFLLNAKLLATSLCVGTGLVGGTFAPSLFLGAVLGVFYQSAAGIGLRALADGIASLQTFLGISVGAWGVIPQLTVADAPAYAMIGAAATLASVFRAPLTASLLLFELTRGYEIVLPLLAAAGTGPLVVESYTRWRKRRSMRMAYEASLGNDDGTDASRKEKTDKYEYEIADMCDVDNMIACEREDDEMALGQDLYALGKQQKRVAGPGNVTDT